MKSVILSVIIVFFAVQNGLAQSDQDGATVESALATVRKVDLHGAGHAEAAQAMKVLNSVSAAKIPLLLEGFEESNPISANWLRAAIQKAASGSSELPVDSIKAYFSDQSKNSQGRWLAWQILCDNDPGFRAKTIDALATDPSMPLREIGIAKMIGDANALGSDVEQMDDASKTRKLSMLGDALENARDVKQIQTIAKALKPLGTEVNLRDHLGFIETWNLVSGFNNKDESGFDVAYEPEKNVSEIDGSSTYTVGGKEASWQATSTEHETGVVDLNKIIGKEKGVIAYATATFESSEDVAAEVRIGTPNAHKIWVNGELVMSNEIYHNSNSIDKFKAPVKLKKGNNSIVLKLCQNEQTQPWAQDWSFQIRFCDSTGKAIR